MIKGPQMKEKPNIIRSDVKYRELPSLNCSMIKLFDSDPVRFFEQFKMGKRKPESKTASLLIGDIVDFYILDCRGIEEEFDNRFDEKFCLYEEPKGTAQVFQLADELFSITKKHVNDKGEITTSFATRFTEAFNKMQAAGKYSGKTEEKALEDFNKNGLTYFTFLMESDGKTVVDVSLLDRAKIVAKNLLEDPFTKDLWQEKDDEEYFPKFAIEWTYTTKSGKEVECKSEVDILKIDHKKKMIFPKDLKTTYDNEGFEYNYLKYRYDLQAGFYYCAVRDWANKEGMEGYGIAPMEFIVGDTSYNNRRPVRYQTSPDDLFASLNGFSINKHRYKGVRELMEEIEWAETTDNWNVSKTVYDNDGKIKLELNYD